MNDGVYEIVNLVTGDRLIGNTGNYQRTMSGHLNRLRQNRHECQPLQDDWNQYGEQNFVFSMMGTYDRDKERREGMEKFWRKRMIEQGIRLYNA